MELAGILSAKRSKPLEEGIKLMLFKTDARTTRFVRYAFIVSVLLVFTTLAMRAHAQQPAPRPHASIVILGDGTPILSADRSGASIGIVVGGTLYVFDAGPGVLRRIYEERRAF
jgi:hypothetical protein